VKNERRAIKEHHVNETKERGRIGIHKIERKRWNINYGWLPLYHNIIELTPKWI
jgi:hypothetical protein